MNTTESIPTLKAHVALNVKDVAASVEFYRAMFGTEPMKVREGYAKFDLQTPALNFSLNQIPAGTATGTGLGALSHLGVQVPTTAEVNAMRGRWLEAGLLPRDEMNVACCYAVQDKAWVTDPDGNEWEVFAVLRDSNVYSTTGALCCAAPAEATAADATAAEAAGADASVAEVTVAEVTAAGACCS